MASIFSAKSDSDAPRGSRRTSPLPRGTCTPPIDGADMLSNSCRRCFLLLRPAPAGRPRGRTRRPCWRRDRRGHRHRDDHRDRRGTDRHRDRRQHRRRRRAAAAGRRGSRRRHRRDGRQPGRAGASPGPPGRAPGPPGTAGPPGPGADRDDRTPCPGSDAAASCRGWDAGRPGRGRRPDGAGPRAAAQPGPGRRRCAAADAERVVADPRAGRGRRPRAGAAGRGCGRARPRRPGASARGAGATGGGRGVVGVGTTGGATTARRLEPAPRAPRPARRRRSLLRRGLLRRRRGAASGNASRSWRATGASTVDDAVLTYSPISLSLARTSLLVTPSSLASCVIRGSCLARVSFERTGRRPARSRLDGGLAHRWRFIECP